MTKQPTSSDPLENGYVRFLDAEESARMHIRLGISHQTISNLTGVSLERISELTAEPPAEYMRDSHPDPNLPTDKPRVYIKYLGREAAARRLAEYEEMARRDEADRQKGAYSQGLQEGRQEGLQEGELKGIHRVAKNLLHKKMPYEDVVDATGLSFEEVKKLAADMG